VSRGIHLRPLPLSLPAALPPSCLSLTPIRCCGLLPHTLPLVWAVQTRGGGPEALVHDQDRTVLDVSSRRVVFVDDEPANCRLGLRMLSKLGIPRENITVLANGM
jgi:hypothetical protein